jgi:hypothetical protein
MSVPSESSYHPTDPTADRPLPGAESSGWIAFAGILLFINGCFTGFWGLAAVLNDEVVTVGGGEGVVIWDVTVWGWTSIVLAILMILTAIGLFTGNSAARWLAVVFATVNALVQFAIVTAFPLWAILVIVIDLVIIYHLIAHWREPDTRVRA